MSLVESALYVMTPAEWGKPIDVDAKWIGFVDDNVKSKLPPCSKIESIVPHGASYWTRAAAVSTRLANGESASYFLKVSQGPNGRNMTIGEYVLTEAIYKTLPEFVPKPIGCGTYAADHNIHFFICELVNMTDNVPEIQAFTSTLAKLHAKGIFSNGMYGFPVHTYKGTIPQYTKWHDTWEESFHHSMKWFVFCEEKNQGPDDENARALRWLVREGYTSFTPPNGGRRTSNPATSHSWGPLVWKRLDQC